MQNYYEIVYPNFTSERFEELVEKFGLDRNRKITVFSKGMKSRYLSCWESVQGQKYLLSTRRLTGLTVLRQAVKSIFAMELMNRRLRLLSHPQFTGAGGYLATMWGPVV